MPGFIPAIPEVQIGAIAYLFGITNNGSPISITGLASFEYETDDLTSTWTEKESADGTGNIQNIAQYNFKFERSIKFNPSGSTRTAAAAVADAVTTLQFLVIANYKVAAFNGTWRIKPGTKINLKQADNASIDISAEKYVNTAQNAAMMGMPIAG